MNPISKNIYNPQAVAGGSAKKPAPLGSVPGVPPSLDQPPNLVSPVRTAAGQIILPISVIPLIVGGAPVRVLDSNQARMQAVLRMNIQGATAASVVLIGGPGSRLPDAVTGKGLMVQGFEGLTLETTDEIWAVNIGAVAASLTGVEISSTENQR